VTVEFQDSAFVEGKRYEVLVVRIKITQSGKGPVLLSPELRAYPGHEELNAELALRSGLREDLLVAVTAAEADGRIALVVRRRPGVLWIWVGGSVMVLAGGALVLTRRRRSERRVNHSEA